MNTVTYIEHSGFLLETDDRALMFDYFEGEIPKTEKPLYIFASHRHHDHFNSKIMDMPCERLILSSDIRVRPNERTVKLGVNKSADIDGMHIRTLRSTDEGVAFIIEYKSMVFYHAGDLNDWYWKEESENWNSKMTESYRRIITEGFNGINTVDIAFLPVDGRLEEYSDRGADFFLENIRTKDVFPMHFWRDYNVPERFCRKHGNAHKITKASQTFVLNGGQDI